MLRQAAEKTGEAVGDGTSTSTSWRTRSLPMACAMSSPAPAPSTSSAASSEAPRRRSRHLRRMSRPVKDAQGEGASRNDLGPQRSGHRRARRRRHGEGRQRRRHHRRGIEDHRDRARRRRGHAVRPRLHLALFHHQRREDGGRAGGCAHSDLRQEDQRPQGPDPPARAGREGWPVRCWWLPRISKARRWPR